MKIILLPGEKRERLAKTQETLFSLSNIATGFLIHYYDHWHEEVEPNHEKELLKLRNLKGDYLILAESEGVELAIKGIYEGKLTPVACIFIKPSKGDSKKRSSATLGEIPALWFTKPPMNLNAKVSPFVRKHLAEDI